MRHFGKIKSGHLENEGVTVGIRDEHPFSYSAEKIGLETVEQTLLPQNSHRFTLGILLY